MSAADPAGLWWAHSDGACRGNPGPSGAGWVLGPAHGAIHVRGHHFLGTRTNNEAEYLAAILAVRDAIARGIDNLLLHADSQLMVRQIEGAYQVRHPNIRPLFASLRETVAKGNLRLAVKHVPRLENQEADACANLAIDRHIKQLQHGHRGAS